MGYNIYFLISLLVIVFVAPFGVINPIIDIIACFISTIFYSLWVVKRGEKRIEQEKELEKTLDSNKKE